MYLCFVDVNGLLLVVGESKRQDNRMVIDFDALDDVGVSLDV